MGKLVKLYILIFLAAVAALASLNLYNTAGSYKALVYYEKTDRGYVLKGVEIYAKPIRASGRYNVELVSSDSQRKILDFNPPMVKIEWQKSSNPNTIRPYIHVYADETVLLKPNTKVRTYVSLKDCLIAEKPIKFKVLLSPVEEGWIVNVDNVDVITSST